MTSDWLVRLRGGRAAATASSTRRRGRNGLTALLALGLAATAASSPTAAQSVDTNSRAFTTLVDAMCGNGWSDLIRLRELGMIDDAFLKKALPAAEAQCNTVFSARRPNGIGGFLALKYNAFSADEISWAINQPVFNGRVFAGARVVARVPRVFALADYYASAESTNDKWEPANLIDVTKNWLAKGGDVNMRSCFGFRLADLLVTSSSPKTTELIKNAGADFNYRTPFIVVDGPPLFYMGNPKAGNQYQINFTMYNEYYYGKEHPSFTTTYNNPCVTDGDLQNTGMPYVEYLVRKLTSDIYNRKARFHILKTVIGSTKLPADIVHAVMDGRQFPSNGLEVLDVLLARGADINARNAEGVTLIDRVFKAGGTPDLLKELTRRGAKL